MNDSFNEKRGFPVNICTSKMIRFRLYALSNIYMGVQSASPPLNEWIFNYKVLLEIKAAAQDVFAHLIFSFVLYNNKVSCPVGGSQAVVRLRLWGCSPQCAWMRCEIDSNTLCTEYMLHQSHMVLCTLENVREVGNQFSLTNRKFEPVFFLSCSFLFLILLSSQPASGEMNDCWIAHSTFQLLLMLPSTCINEFSYFNSVQGCHHGV